MSEEQKVQALAKAARSLERIADSLSSHNGDEFAGLILARLDELLEAVKRIAERLESG